MNQATIQKLLNSREGQELVAFLKGQIAKLDTTADISPRLTKPFEIALEVIARQRAQEKLALILKPFLDYHEPTDTTPERETDIYYDHSPKDN